MLFKFTLNISSHFCLAYEFHMINLRMFILDPEIRDLETEGFGDTYWTFSWIDEAEACGPPRTYKIALVEEFGHTFEYFTEMTVFSVASLVASRLYNVTVVAVNESGEEIGTAASLSLNRDSRRGKLRK